MVLTQKAKNMGGDRYETMLSPDDKRPYVIYLPQSITRKDGNVKKEVTLIIAD